MLEVYRWSWGQIKVTVIEGGRERVCVKKVTAKKKITELIKTQTFPPHRCSPVPLHASLLSSWSDFNGGKIHIMLPPCPSHRCMSTYINLQVLQYVLYKNNCIPVTVILHPEVNIHFCRASSLCSYSHCSQFIALYSVMWNVGLFH